MAEAVRVIGLNELSCRDGVEQHLRVHGARSMPKILPER